MSGPEKGEGVDAAIYTTDGYRGTKEERERLHAADVEENMRWLFIYRLFTAAGYNKKYAAAIATFTTLGAAAAAIMVNS